MMTRKKMTRTKIESDQEVNQIVVADQDQDQGRAQRSDQDRVDAPERGRGHAGGPVHAVDRGRVPAAAGASRGPIRGKNAAIFLAFDATERGHRSSCHYVADTGIRNNIIEGLTAEMISINKFGQQFFFQAFDLKCTV